MDHNYETKGRTIRYLGGGGGGGGGANNRKNIVHNKPIEKKIEQELGMIFKIVMQLF